MNRIIKRLTAFLFVVGVVVALLYAFRPQPVAVDLETVVRGSMRVTIDEEGETRLRDRFLVSAPVPGRVLRIDLEPGDRVQAGRTVIATFRPTEPALLDARTRREAEARVRAAEVAVSRARANRDRIREQLAFAESQATRYSELFEQGLAARERFETAEFEARSRREALNAAEFGVRDAEQAVEVARATLIQITEDTTTSNEGVNIAIRAPTSGVVLRRMRESESVVPAGEPLVEIGDTSKIEIVADFLSADAVQISAGDKVLIEQWGGGITLQGRVRLVEPSGFTKLSALGVEEQRVNVVIDFVDAVEASRYLGDGFRVEIRIVTWETANALKIPTSALFRSGNDWSVFTASDGIANLRYVDIGQRNGLEAQVLSGLSESETVIVYPGDDVSDGVEVVSR